MKDIWLKWKNEIRSLFIGLFFTLVLAYLSINYYASDFDKRETHPNPFIGTLHRLHQASIDWRLRIRGPRKGSEDIVILAVDEKSLVQEGQWPWPRGKFADIITRVMDGGAKAIGFDVVWAEEEQNNSVEALRKLKRELPSNSDIINRHIQAAQTDRQLGAVIEKYRDRLILGSYFQPPSIGEFVPKHGHENLCLEEIYRQSKQAPFLDGQEEVLINDQTLALVGNDEIPEPWLDVLEPQFEKIKKETADKFIQERMKKGLSEKLSTTARIEKEQQINEALWSYCRRWLNPPDHSKPDEAWEGYKELWEEVREEDEDYAGLSFEEGVKKFKGKLFSMKMNLIGDWILNVPSIQGPTRHTGYFNAKQDSDGTIRRSFLMVRSGRSFFPSMSFLTYLVATGQKARVNLNHDTLDLDGRFKAISEFELTDEEGNPTGVVPTDKSGYLTINYAGKQRMFAHLSLADVLNEEPTLKIREKKYVKREGEWGWGEVVTTHDKKDFYKDKIFVVGATATGIFDLRVTPFEEAFPGVETHANVLDNLLRKDFLKTAVNEGKYMLFFILITGVLFTVIVGRFGALPGFISSVTFLSSIYIADHFYFFKNGYIISIVIPFILVFGIYGLLTIYKYFTEEKNKKQLKGTFGKYVSPAIVEEILAHPENIELGGRKQEVTVFFSDVRGFTTISEMLDAAALSDLLNEYLSPMTEIIFENNGTLDKYIGDAIMAFFGAPIHHSNHAEHGCRAALQNVEKLLELQKGFQERKLPDIDIGIGLNTGEVNVGNMGSNTVRNYTIMGDSVNLGARLEGITKQYGVRIIISEFTEKQLGSQFFRREVDWVKVKGKNEPVRIFELMGEGELITDLSKVRESFVSGYNFYHEMQWEKAIKSFETGLKIHENDGPSKLYLQRCKDYLASPPPENWDGVFTMTTK